MIGRPPAERSERDHVSFDWSKLRKTRGRDVGIRFGFGAGVSLTAAIIGARFGARVGGAFLAFPAILPATLTLLEEHDSRHSAEHDCRGAAAGAFGLAAFAAVLVALPHQPAIALPLATVAWLVVAVASYLVWRRVREALHLDRGGRRRPSLSSSASMSSCGPEQGPRRSERIESASRG